MFVTTTRLPFFACQKDAAGTALKRAAPALGPGQQKSRLRLHPESGGSWRLRNTASKCILKVPVAVALLAYICMIEEKKFNWVVLKNIPVPYGTSIIPEDAGYKQQPVIIQIITCRY